MGGKGKELLFIIFFFRRRVIYPKVRSFTRGVNQRSAPPLTIKHSFPKLVLNSFTNFEKIQVVYSTFYEKMPCHHLYQLAVGDGLEGENVFNNYMLGQVLYSYDTLCQSQLHAKRQT